MNLDFNYPNGRTAEDVFTVSSHCDIIELNCMLGIYLYKEFFFAKNNLRDKTLQILKLTNLN